MRPLDRADHAPVVALRCSAADHSDHDRSDHAAHRSAVSARCCSLPLAVAEVDRGGRSAAGARCRSPAGRQKCAVAEVAHHGGSARRVAPGCSSRCSREHPVAAHARRGSSELRRWWPDARCSLDARRVEPSAEVARHDGSAPRSSERPAAVDARRVAARCWLDARHAQQPPLAGERRALRPAAHARSDHAADQALAHHARSAAAAAEASERTCRSAQTPRSTPAACTRARSHQGRPRASPPRGSPPRRTESGSPNRDGRTAPTASFAQPSPPAGSR